jgi:hypothetical protein
MRKPTNRIDGAYYYADWLPSGNVRLTFIAGDGLVLGQVTFAWSPPQKPLSQAVLRQKLEEVRRRGQSAGAANHGIGATAASNVPAKPIAPAGSLEVVLESIYADLCPRWAESTRGAFRRAKDFLLESLPPLVSRRPLKRVDRKSYSAVATALAADKKHPSSKYFRKQDLKRLTWELVGRGLPKGCGTVFDSVQVRQARQP